jgi:murein DD-endopeptidase MepM/ murein hydrolase activator NlpD
MKKIFIALSISTICLLATVFLINTSGIETHQIPAAEAAFKPEPVEYFEYGIPTDSFEVFSDKVRPNQTLGSIFESAGVRGEYIRQLSTIGYETLDIRKIRAGNNYKVFYQRDSSQEVQYLVYEQTSTEFVVFHFGDSLTVRADKKNIIAVTKLSEAEISTSLWEAMKDYNLNPVLALDLSEVFAWTIDFFGLHKGDKFKVLYDELHVGGQSVGIGTIHAAWFEHRGQTYYAFRFQQDSVWSYWDEQGNSLRKAFLKSPLRFSRITSRFSNSRLHPILRIYRPHTGVDYAAPEGTPVMAIGDGVVAEKGYNHAAGNFIKIKHNSVYTTGYYHFSKFGSGISQGTRVLQGQVIGYVGKTGYATGPHLDLRFWKNGKAIDPLKVEAPSVEPIKEMNKELFAQLVSGFRVKLDSISPRPILPSYSIDLQCR